MAIGIGAKFNELFNVDDAEDQLVAARLALHEVMPGSLSADSKYSTNELNRKRRSVTNRESRVGQIRSAYTMDERQEAASEGRQPAPTFEDPRYAAREGGRSEGYESAGGGGGAAYGGGVEGGGPVSDAVVSDLLSSAGMTALGTGGLLTSLGVSPLEALGPSVGVGLQSLTGLGALNTLAGGIAGYYSGNEAAERELNAGGFSPEDIDYGSREVMDATEAARMASMNRFGAVGMGIQGIGSLLSDWTGIGDIQSPIEEGQQAFNVAMDESTFGPPTGGGAQLSQPGVLQNIGNFLSSAFTAPTQEELKDTFNMETLQSISGGQMGVSGGAQADDTMADGSRRGSVFGGSQDINEPAAPDAGALTDTQVNVQDTTGSVVADTPADVAPSQPKGIESGIDTTAQKEAALGNSIREAREALMSSTGTRQHKEMGLQISRDTQQKLAALNALERQAGLPETTVSGVSADPWSGTSSLKLGMRAPSRWSNDGSGHGFIGTTDIEKAIDTYGSYIAGGQLQGLLDLSRQAAGSRLGGGGWTDLGGGVKGDFSGERDSEGNAISG